MFRMVPISTHVLLFRSPCNHENFFHQFSLTYTPADYHGMFKWGQVVMELGIDTIHLHNHGE